MHIRYQLLDLVKRYFGPEGAGRHYETPGMAFEQATQEAISDEPDPTRILEWQELHALIAELPEELREVVDLRDFQGLRWGEIAGVLGVNARTVRRRHMAARVWLARRLGKPVDSIGE